jgi:hypothetical protein
VGELALIMAHSQGKADADVVLTVPRTADREWVQNQLRRDAEAIPGVHVIEDIGAVETRRFGAATSGQTLLYDAQGTLWFNGGITASRGHRGSSYGRDSLVSLIESGRAEHQSGPVFGCCLLGED